MPSSGSNSYDDLLLIEEQRKEKESSGSLSPFTYLCIALIIALFGLIVLYSSSYGKALSEGHPHYFYFIRNAIAAASGLIAGSLFSTINLKKVKKAYIVFMPLSLISLILQLIPGFSSGYSLSIGGHELLSAPSFGLFALIFIIAGLFPDESDETRSYLLPSVIIALYLLLILFTGGIGWYVLSVIITILSLRVKGVRISALILLFLFAFVILAGAVFIDYSLLSPVAFSLFPVSDSELYNQALIASRSAIAEGGIAGSGLGRGIYKLGTLSSPESTFIFASLSEEMGLVGTLWTIFLFVLIGILGCRSCLRSVRKKDRSAGVIAIGLSFSMVLCAFASMAYAAGVLPFPGILMPFFSYGIFGEFLSVFSAVILYRFIYVSGREGRYEKK